MPQILFTYYAYVTVLKDMNLNILHYYIKNLNHFCSILIVNTNNISNKVKYFLISLHNMLIRPVKLKSNNSHIAQKHCFSCHYMYCQSHLFLALESSKSGILELWTYLEDTSNGNFLRSLVNDYLEFELLNCIFKFLWALLYAFSD